MNIPKKNYKVSKFRDTFVIGLSANKPTMSVSELKELLKDLAEIKGVLLEVGEDTSFLDKHLPLDEEGYLEFLDTFFSRGPDSLFPVDPEGEGAQRSFHRGDHSLLDEGGIVLDGVKNAQDRFEEYLKKKDEELQAQLEISRKVWSAPKEPEGVLPGEISRF